MKPTLEVLEIRCCPTVTYHGGHVLQAPEVANVFIGGYRADLDQLADIMAGDYTAYLGVYGISRGSHDGTLMLPSQGAMNRAGLESLLLEQIAAGNLPPPSADQMYMIYLDQKLTDANLAHAGAFHYYTAYYPGGNIFAVENVPYGVAYLNDPPGSAGFSHELAETFTDPTLRGWYDGQPQTGEVADLTAGRALLNLDGQKVVAVAGPDDQPILQPTPYTPLPQQTTVPLLYYYLQADLAVLAAAYQRGDYGTALLALLAYETTLVQLLGV
jgi:hypothetical protein